MAGSLTQIEMEALDEAARTAMQARDFHTARRCLAQLAEADPDHVEPWLKLAAVCRGLGDLQAALDALDRGLIAAPRHYVALLMRATLMEKTHHPDAADAFGIALTQAPENEALLDGPTLAATRHAREVHARHIAAKRDFLAKTVEEGAHQRSAFEQKKIRFFIEDALHLRTRYVQEPVQFYYPGLPHYEYFERDLFPWLEAFEAATDEIREELLGVIDEGFTGFTPYVEYDATLPLDQWKDLNHNPDWGAFHLVRGGRRYDQNADRCPRTMAALSKLPQPSISNRGPNAMFSALKPHTRIPPHTGVSNTRLVCHLPLIMPDQCFFRVGNETRPWKMGEAWVFDDTINHEAWNDSDEVRIILLVDVWNPFINPVEQVAIKAAMEAMDAYGASAPTEDG